jgi:hypothetical protein
MRLDGATPVELRSGPALGSLASLDATEWFAADVPGAPRNLTDSGSRAGHQLPDRGRDSFR